MKKVLLSSYEINTIAVLKEELTVPSITPTYRQELTARLSFLENINSHPPKTEQSTLT